MKIFAKIEYFERYSDSPNIEYIGPYCTKSFTLRECMKGIKCENIRREVRESSHSVTHDIKMCVKNVDLEECVLTFYNITKINDLPIT